MRIARSGKEGIRKANEQANKMLRERSAMLTNEMKAHLTGKILPFWQNLTDWARGGWYGYVDKDLNVLKDSHKGCILNSRVLWTFATADRVLGEDVYLTYERHALMFIDRFE